MYQKSKLIVWVFLLTFTIQLTGANVNSTDAFKSAKNFIKENNLNIIISQNKVEFLVQNDGNKVLAYIFNGCEKGFIVLSVNNQISPVISYNKENIFDKNSPLASMILSDMRLRNLNLDKMDQSYLLGNKNEWKRLLDGKSSERRFQQWPPQGTTTTGGWTVTTWNQSAPYNSFCPKKLSSNQRSLTGCPSTAMAQILVYHNEINQTRFNSNDRYYHNYTQQFWIDDAWETYEFLSFDSLNVFLDSIEVKFEQNRELDNNEKAALSLAAGFACKSVYDPAGSGTFSVNQAYDAFLRFGFSQAVLLDSASSNEAIIQKMISNIKNAMPVHLAVVDPAWSSGHNVVCDGYRDNGFFRLNMGWGGSYDNWYNLPQGFPFSLTVFEGIVADIRKYDPNTFQLSLQANLELIESEILGAGFYSTGQIVDISASLVENYLFDGWSGATEDLALLNDSLSITASFVMPNRNVSLTANFYGPLHQVMFIIVDASQQAIEGAQIRVLEPLRDLVTNADGYATTELASGTFNYTVVAQNYETFSASFTINSDNIVVPINLQPSIIAQTNDNKIVVNNPFESFLQITGVTNVSEIKLFGMDGNLVVNFSTLNNNDIIIPTKHIKSGVYILILTENDGKKIIKKVVKE